MATSISNGFRHPLGSGTLTEVTPEIDSFQDGYYSAQDFGEANTEIVAGQTAYQLGEVWNGARGGDNGLGDPGLAFFASLISHNCLSNTWSNSTVTGSGACSGKCEA